MVLHKRLDYGSTGYQVPPMPLPRSAKGKRSVRRRLEDKQISAFDLLATVAGELLSERENSPPSLNGSIKKEKKENAIPFKAEVFDQGSCNESTLRDPKVEVAMKTSIQSKRRMDDTVIDEKVPVISEDPMDLDTKPPALVSSDSSAEVPISRNRSFPKSINEMEQLPVDRDDDENSSVCTHPSTKSAKGYRYQRIGDRRIRKLLASKFWKVPAFKEGEVSNTDVEMKPIFRNRKICYTRQRTQRSSFKRRKLFERSSISASTGGIYGEGVSNLPKFGGLKIEATDAHANMIGANGASSSSSGQKSSYDSGDYHVKFSIKSFKVPELYIEIPETATVGSLKRTVMEAVTAILAGGLRVGVVRQGKKVRDDKQTLVQAGLSCNDTTDNLGFMLEPSSTQTQASLTRPEDPNSLLSLNPVPASVSTEPIPRIQAEAPLLDQVPPKVEPDPPQTLLLIGPDSDHDSVRSQTDASCVDKSEISKALVPVADMSGDALAVIPLRKSSSKRSELAQRRIRRPFSVAEVEALVQAVEKLGTGRWRDVKIRAFDSAKHRTYVDLKDKWKTLVHTARISPQQRRGEPVPQELLDRVLAAHAYWSQQQAKLQVKPI